jgi:hypothetical protein
MNSRIGRFCIGLPIVVGLAGFAAACANVYLWHFRGIRIIHPLLVLALLLCYISTLNTILVHILIQQRKRSEAMMRARLH